MHLTVKWKNFELSLNLNYPTRYFYISINSKLNPHNRFSNTIYLYYFKKLTQSAACFLRLCHNDMTKILFSFSMKLESMLILGAPRAKDNQNSNKWQFKKILNAPELFHWNVQCRKITRKEVDVTKNVITAAWTNIWYIKIYFPPTKKKKKA